MKSILQRAFFGLVLEGLIWMSLPIPSLALEYPSNPALTAKLQALAQEHHELVHLKALAHSLSKQEVWLVELGAGQEADRLQRPAMLLVAGIEGNDLAGTVSALAWVEHLAGQFEKKEPIRRLLNTTTIYVCPRLNQDAAEHCFTHPHQEQLVSNRPVDDDHDGLVDEDGPDDLDGNGLITQMRVKDPEGDYILDPNEPRLLIKADQAKGETGVWRLLTEGRDNDHDEAWNEDGPGGVNFNRNFPYDYRFFAADSGAHQVSEAETRALADFVVAHPNIGIVFTFGAADNLTQTPKGEPGGKRPPKAIHEDDLPFYRELGHAWREALGLKKELNGGSEPGTFSDWMYYDRGRNSLAARAWSPSLQLELAKAAKEKAEAEKEVGQAEPKARAASESKSKPAAEKKKSSDDNRNAEDRAFLKWLDENAPGAFLPWKAFQHPDFPGKQVEIGGFAPFVRSNPPENLLPELTVKHAKFLTELAGNLPRIGIRQAKAKHLGSGIYEITVQVENTGYLPTSLAQGQVTDEVYPTRVVLKLDPKAFLSGRRTTPLETIDGSGGMREVRYTVHVKGQGKVDIEVISMLGGTAQATIELNAKE